MLKAYNGIYKGKNPDNYLKINNKLWRIISHSQDGSIKIISTESPEKLAWTSTTDTNFTSSNINTYLNKTFYNSVNNLAIKKSDFCLNYNKENCQQKIKITIGLLTTYDYLNASNNANCKIDTIQACKDGNYLSDFSIENGPEYTMNYTKNEIYIIKDGLIGTANPHEILNIRPVLAISKTAKIIGGSGTKDNPYILNEV